jgi:AcrR family transcriptional regulator
MPTKRDVPAPAERLLETATTLFGLHGIRAVGIDRLLEEAKVARASMYQAFGSKDGLVVAYLARQHANDQAAYQSAVEHHEAPIDRVLAAFDLAESGARRLRYRGCLYLNAATEFPDHAHPVTAAALEHRQWLHDQWLACLRHAGAADPAALANQVQLLYDGALAGSKASRSCEPIRLARQMAEQMIRRAIAEAPAVAVTRPAAE